MLKKDVLTSSNPAKEKSDANKCGHCIHFRHVPLSSNDEPCEKLGVKSMALAPNCFFPDVTKLSKNSDTFVQIAAQFQTFTPDERRVYRALLSQKTKAGQHVMGTKLYFRVGKDFISNYLCGYVVGYQRSGEILLMGSPGKVRGQTFLAFMEDVTTMLTHTQWVAKRKELRAANLIFDTSNKIVQKSSVTDNYEPPSIDGLSKDALMHVQKKPKARKTTKRDVVESMQMNIIAPAGAEDD